MPEFADQINETIEYMRRGINKQLPDTYKTELTDKTEDLTKRIEHMLSSFKVKTFDEIVPENLSKNQQSLYDDLKDKRMEKQHCLEMLTDLPKFQKRQLAFLEELKKEAQDRVSKNQVTYDWWLRYNVRLAKWASPTDRDYTSYWWRKDLSYEDLLEKYPRERTALQYMFPISHNSFPGLILMPTRDDLGIMALNEASQNGIVPIGVMNRNSLWVDGGKNFSPSDYIVHDLNHASNGYGGTGDFFYTHIKKKMEKMNTEDRQKVETVYFYITHERSEIRLDSSNIQSFKNDSLEGNLIARLGDNHDLGGLVSKDAFTVQRYVNEAVDLFFQVAESAFKQEIK